MPLNIVLHSCPFILTFFTQSEYALISIFVVVRTARRTYFYNQIKNSKERNSIPGIRYRIRLNAKASVKRAFEGAATTQR